MSQTLTSYLIHDEIDADGHVVGRQYLPLTLRWIYRYEFEHLLARTGFIAEVLFGDFSRTPFDENSTEMIWIARRD